MIYTDKERQEIVVREYEQYKLQQEVLINNNSLRVIIRLRLQSSPIKSEWIIT